MQRLTLTLITLFTLSIPCSWAQDINFSRAYILPSQSTQQLKIAGIEVRSGDELLINWVLLGFDAENRVFSILQAGAQTSDAEWLAQRLRDTVWSGIYETATNLYLTELRFLSVHDGLIMGEMTHQTADPEATHFLRCTVAGEILTQYFVEREGKFIWVNANEVNYQGSFPPAHTRHLLRLKRLRALEHRHSNQGWGSHTEYWLTLENNQIKGSVGTPEDRYSTQEALSGNGIITLDPISPTVLPAAPIFLE